MVSFTFRWYVTLSTCRKPAGALETPPLRIFSDLDPPPIHDVAISGVFPIRIGHSQHDEGVTSS